ncbi:MAG: hypothetical protein NZM29_02535 [Nitrospira sp.]|nr:hypothetical protein [Nitrospira sp.]
MSIDPELLSILCCPETKQTVKVADDSLVSSLNEQIRQGKIKNRADRVVMDILKGGLIRADGKVLYPIVDDIPVMLIEEGIPIDQLI